MLSIYTVRPDGTGKFFIDGEPERDPSSAVFNFVWDYPKKHPGAVRDVDAERAIEENLRYKPDEGIIVAFRDPNGKISRFCLVLSDPNVWTNE